ncbi:DgyrCDS11792 [Dimorphilus gyrociliatus]|uniref:DgyrCDS11792 n=1 Tax=Dimorphilus gyrociliatus TaxID=2664684 RepID=A0A7I8W4H9_9ANNE|nr:DgyrCDS11792 [Dimorphilus gyrociliatus]
MADSASELESDTNSMNDGPTARLMTPNHIEYMQRRMESLQQENVVLKTELEKYKQRVKTLEDDNVRLRRASVSIQARAEQEEEFISNTLLKTIETLKKDKEELAMKYEQEEECLTNDLSRKLFQLQQEKQTLETTLEHEQQKEINKLKKNTERLEADIKHKQALLEELRRDKVQLENELEHEQEALVNRLWKRMSTLESEKRRLQQQLNGHTDIPSPRNNIEDDSSAASLRNEVYRLRQQVTNLQADHERRTAESEAKEKSAREENTYKHRRPLLSARRERSLSENSSEVIKRANTSSSKN